jgi:hypothetical protein
MNKNLIFLPAVLGVLLAGSVLGVRAVRADTEISAKLPFVEDLARELGVSENAVTNAMGTIKDERRGEMRGKREASLDEAVADGVITGEQKQMLLDHWEDMREQREQRRAEMQEWREQSGIDFEALRGYACGGGMGGEFGMRGGRGPKGW